MKALKTRGHLGLLPILACFSYGRQVKGATVFHPTMQRPFTPNTADLFFFLHGRSSMTVNKDFFCSLVGITMRSL